MDEVKGFKAFNIDSTNRHGELFTEGSTHRVTGEIKFGNDGNGYHLCTHLSDVFRYVKGTEKNVLVAEVTGRGAFVKRDDEFYGYYDMYAFEEMTVDRFLSREEVIQRMLCSASFDVRKFLITCRLSENEKVLFARKFRYDSEIIKHLLYYHYGCKSVFKEFGLNEKKQLRLVLKNGQDNN